MGAIASIIFAIPDFAFRGNASGDGEPGRAADSRAVSYLRDVRPILSQHCFQCHGPDEAARKGKLRLDLKESAIAGRDHQQLCGGLLLLGGGFRGGISHGETDDWGWDVVKDPVHVHDVQATVLHALGLDHLKLVTRYQGRDFRLTDVGGNVVNALLE
jgi:hypothetical protein